MIPHIHGNGYCEATQMVRSLISGKPQPKEIHDTGLWSLDRDEVWSLFKKVIGSIKTRSANPCVSIQAILRGV